MFSRVPGSGAFIVIAESGMLMAEVMQSSCRPIEDLGQDHQLGVVLDSRVRTTCQNASVSSGRTMMTRTDPE
jgi:hypothetical protein